MGTYMAPGRRGPNVAPAKFVRGQPKYDFDGVTPRNAHARKQPRSCSGVDVCDDVDEQFYDLRQDYRKMAQAERHETHRRAPKEVPGKAEERPNVRVGCLGTGLTEVCADEDFAEDFDDDITKPLPFLGSGARNRSPPPLISSC